MLSLNRAHQKENKNLIPFTIGTISCKKNIERKNIKETRRYLVVPLIGISVWKLFYVPTYTGNTRNIDVIPVGVYVCLLVYCVIFFLLKYGVYLAIFIYSTFMYKTATSNEVYSCVINVEEIEERVFSEQNAVL